MADTLQHYLRAFRIRELQYVLKQFGLPHSGGRKADLLQRIQTYLEDAKRSGNWRYDAAQRAITYTYQNMANPAALDADMSFMSDTWSRAEHAVRAPPPPPAPALPAPGAPVTSRAPYTNGFTPELNGYPPVNGRLAPASPPRPQASPAAKRQLTHIRCVCGVTADRGRMIQCQGDGCGVWQHDTCVGIGEAQSLPRAFHCELCRAALADPFWEAVPANVFPPALLQPASPPGAGPGYVARRPLPDNSQQSVSRSFDISASELQRAKQPDHQLQLGCLMLPDPVPARMHWPRFADLRVNSMSYRPYGRQANVKIGGNIRDEPANIGTLTFQGRNKVTLTAQDERAFVLITRLCRRRGVEQVRAMLPPPETVEAAVQRVKRAITGDVGGDDDFVATSAVVSLRDPLSGSRIVTPARFKPVPGLAAFDLDTFLAMAQRSRKWQCPTSGFNGTVHDVQVDAFIGRKLAQLKDDPEVEEVEVNVDGQWRPEGRGGRWRTVDEDPAAADAADAASHAARENGSVAVKPEPGLTGNGHVGPAGPTELSSGSSEGGESESESAELRRAAAAYAATTSRKRHRSPEVIVLSSDSDDDVPLPRRPAPARVNTVQAVSSPRDAAGSAPFAVPTFASAPHQQAPAFAPHMPGIPGLPASSSYGQQPAAPYVPSQPLSAYGSAVGGPRSPPPYQAQWLAPPPPPPPPPPPAGSSWGSGGPSSPAGGGGAASAVLWHGMQPQQTAAAAAADDVGGSAAAYAAHYAAASAAADPYWSASNQQPGAPPLPGRDDWDDFMDYGLEY